MTAILTPALALRHLRQLSTDVRAAVVLAATDLAVLAREGEGPTPADGTSPPGTVVAASDDQHVLAVLAGPQVLLPLLRHDLATLLADLRAEGASGEPAEAPVASGPESAEAPVAPGPEPADAPVTPGPEPADAPAASAPEPAAGPATPSPQAASSRVQVLERADSAVSAAIFAGLGIPATGNS
jgi:hypothetical protein